MVYGFFLKKRRIQMACKMLNSIGSNRIARKLNREMKIMKPSKSWLKEFSQTKRLFWCFKSCWCSKNYLCSKTWWYCKSCQCFNNSKNSNTWWCCKSCGFSKSCWYSKNSWYSKTVDDSLVAHVAKAAEVSITAKIPITDDVAKDVDYPITYCCCTGRDYYNSCQNPS
jgi:hypothetical protein